MKVRVQGLAFLALLALGWGASADELPKPSTPITVLESSTSEAEREPPQARTGRDAASDYAISTPIQIDPTRVFPDEDLPSVLVPTLPADPLVSFMAEEGLEIRHGLRQKTKDLLVAVEDRGDDQFLAESLIPLLEHVRLRNPSWHIEVVEIPSAYFEETLERRGIGILVASAGKTIALQSALGAQQMASRRSAAGQVGVSSEAGAVFVVPRTSDIEALPGLRDKRVAVPADASLVGSWEMARGALIDAGFSSEGFFRDVQTVEGELQVIQAVLSGQAEAAILPTCALERLLLSGLMDPAALRVVGGRNTDVPGQCVSCTPLYPDWVISFTPAEDDETVRLFTSAVYSFPVDGIYRWGPVRGLNPVDQLMQKLRIGPYEYLADWTLEGFLRRYGKFLLAALGGLLFLIFHSVRTEALVRKRTRALTEALESRERLEKEALRTREKLLQLERLGTVSLMSSMFAHEVKQPLTSIINYSAGLRIFLDTCTELRQETASMLEGALEGISGEAERVKAIVDRVRGYAKHRNVPLEPTNLWDVVEEVRRVYERSDSTGVPLRLVPGRAGRAAALVLADPVELELLFLNITRNAAQASQGVSGASVTVAFSREGSACVVRVVDSGPRLDDKAFARLTSYGESVKSDGLGLGLSICRGIIDRHGGSLVFYRNAGQGLVAEVRLEAAGEEGAGKPQEKAPEETVPDASGDPGSA